MPRRPPRDSYDDNPHNSDSDPYDRDLPPRRRGRERIDDDLDYARRKSSPVPPLDELARIRMRDRSAEDLYREYFSPRREPRRRSPVRVHGGIERDKGAERDRGRYVEGDSDEDVRLRKGGWTANPGGYASDEEESLGRERIRSRWEARNLPDPDYGRRGSYPRRSGRGEWDKEDEEPTGRDRRRRKRGRSPPGDFSPRRSARDEWDTEYGMGREYFHDRGFSRSPTRSRYRDDESLGGHRGRRRRDTRSPPEWDDEHHDAYPRHSARDELDMEYGMGREDIHDRRFSRSPTRSRYRGDDDEIGIRKYTKRRSPRKTEAREDEFLIREHRSPPRFRDDVWNQDEWTRSRNSDDDYGSPRQPRAPSPGFRSPRSSLDDLGTRNRGARRRRPSNEDILDESQDRNNSPSSVRRLSPEPDDWLEPEDASRSRRGPRSLHRNEDSVASEWTDTQRSKGALDEFEEHAYRRRSAGQHSSSDSVTGDWAIADSPPASRRLMRDEFDGAGREIRQPRQGRERRPRIPSSDRRSDDDAERRAQVGRRYVGAKDRRERLWTEITKDLVVREAIERAGYEFEETGLFYYIFDYLQYDDVSALVDLSDNIRQARRRRIHEIHRERTSLPHPPVSAARRSAPLLLERGPSPRIRTRETMERELAFDDRKRRPLPRPEW